MRIALLSNVSVDALARMLPGHEVWTPPGFGAWAETAFAPEGLAAFRPEAIFLLLDRSHGKLDDCVASVAKEKLEAAFPLATAAIVDLEDLATEAPDFYDERMWLLASQPWSLNGLKAIANEIDRLAGLMRTGAKKALALDFDGVLWDGVAGEDGAVGIKPIKPLQDWLLRLKERGVILVGLSKNNAEDVEPLWKDPRMAVGKGDFAAMRVDWNGKAANLAAIAKELNLGLDAFVFLDDNPAERAEMSAKLPMVETPDWPMEIDRLSQFLRHVERLYFPAFRLTQEDKEKTAQYQAEAERRALAADATIKDYLASLEIWVDVHPLRDEEIPRVAQLSQKTNQFNVATNRYTADEIAALGRDALVLSVHSGDRFGDLGLIAFVAARYHGGKASIIDFVMSCRAMNRRIEFAIEEELEKRLAALGVSEIAAAWKRTAKNKPVESLFEALGYTLTEAAPDEKHYRKLAAMPGKRPSCDHPETCFQPGQNNL
ncbi:MAG: HAD-IIIC family phosphatase [Kiritimatiellae bacterium]|nr:HAD-IIIC family phosphatase [Kiritimatiellia bacterium]